MTGQRPTRHDEPVAAAMELVLAAERDGELRLRAARERAQAIVAAGRAEAASIGHRADARIARLHASHVTKMQRNIAELAETAAAAAERAANPYAPAALVDVARRVAAALTGQP